jgi:hypothetical protein
MGEHSLNDTWWISIAAKLHKVFQDELLKIVTVSLAIDAECVLNEIMAELIGY